MTTLHSTTVQIKGFQVDLSRAVWRKSTRSGPWTDNCVEVGVWQTSTRSTPQAQCVEVAGDLDGVLVRDTKDRDGGTQRYTRTEWLAFIEGVKAGEFDLA